ncbi:MAG: methyl-accepting chemotaxis protein [Xanthobacteraceae bacterium]
MPRWGRRTETTALLGALGEMQTAIRDNLERVERLRTQDAKLQQRDALRASSLEQASTTFRSAISAVVATLTRETAATRSTAGVLAGAASSAFDQAQAASMAASGAADNAQAVAAATEQLGASIREISTRAQRASVIVAEAAEGAKTTDRDVAGLSEAAQRIGAVVELIRSIAEQTNLLALNATIEAARAGEAGRGFAVVASEVKTLATQTAKATQDIAHQIGAVQSSTSTAVGSIRRIATRVDEIHGLTSSIAAAVEQQEAATREISRNVAQAADGSRLAATTVDGLTTTATDTKHQSEQLVGTSAGLTGAVRDLSSAVEVFIADIAADLDDRRSAERQRITRAVVITANGERHETQSIDVSLTGTKITNAPDLAPGMNVDIDLGSGPIPCTTVWASKTEAGLKFDKALAELPTGWNPARDPERLAA